MSDPVEQRLAELGISLEAPGAPGANYVPVVRSGNLAFVSGQVSLADGVAHKGKLGAGIELEAGRTAARACAISLFNQLSANLGGLDAVARFVKLTGFVNCVPDFTDIHLVINGASDLIVDVYGDRGRHARSAIGMASLPLGFAVEVEAIVEVK